MGAMHARRERFCELLADGLLPVHEAYAQAGYKPNTGNSSVLSRKPYIVERVKEIKAARAFRDAEATKEAAKSMAITKERMMAMAHELWLEARAAGQYSAAATCLKEMGVLSGVRVERSERGAPNEFGDTSTADLLKELRELGYNVSESDTLQ